MDKVLIGNGLCNNDYIHAYIGHDLYKPLSEFTPSMCSGNIHSLYDMTHPWNFTTANFLHIKGKLLVLLGHPWVHHKHADIETMSFGFKMSHPL